MGSGIHNKPKGFFNRKVSVSQAMKLLKRNWIQVNDDQAQIILKFLYVIAKTYRPVVNLNDTRP
jgi:hypothetical protein